ncbi:MAG: hypothetical protein H6Q10_1098, partial [Acidobacteria bacterium]|nr:hypothetical protein [Acidobacteriota bacterium]
MLPGTGRAARREVQVGGQLRVEPRHHRPPEAPHHDAHRDGHRDGGGQRGDQHRRPAQRPGEAPRGEQGLDAEGAPQGGRGDPGQGVHERGDGQGAGADQQQRGEVAEEGLPADRGGPRRQRRPHAAEARGREVAEAVHAHRRLAFAPRHRDARRDGGRLPRGRDRRRERDGQAGAQREQHDGDRQPDLARRAADVERLDRRGHQRDGARRHDPPQRDAEQPAGKAEERRLEQEGQQHHPARGAEGAGDPDLRPAPDDRDRYRVVDQERADDEGDVAQDAQVPPEGREHRAVLLGAGAAGPDLDPARQR